MSKTRIVAAILDTQKLSVYKEDGSLVEIRQGDVRVKRIIEESQQGLSTVGYADVDLNYADAETNTNHYHEVEKKSSGIVRFFRVAKEAVKKFFNPETEGEHLEPVVLGSIPVAPAESVPVLETMQPVEAVAQQTKAESVPSMVQDATKNQKPSLNKAIDDIMSKAEPVSDPKFNRDDHNKDTDTMIAVVTTPNGPKIIPGVENLDKQLATASKLGSTIGVQRFLERLGAVIDQRGHSVQELMNFMSRGDLPIADDGSIIGYKVLKSAHGKPGYYVDCHTGKVVQRIGSFVSQKNVDESRRTQCSTGLHIARRAYLGRFSGDIITLVKIAPEDVMAVPEREPDKMRARGYHILSEIPKNEHARLHQNQPIGGMEAKRLLGMAIRGNHIDVIEDVIIGGAYGSNLEIVARKDAIVKIAPVPTAESHVAGAIPDKKVEAGRVPPVDTKAVAEKVADTKQASVTPVAPAPVAEPIKAEPAKEETRAQKIDRLVEVLRTGKDNNVKVDAARELIQIGKTAKKSLSKLGLSDANINLVNQFAQIQAEPMAQVVAPAETKTKKKNPPAKGESPAAKEVKADHVATKSKAEQIKDLADKALKGDRKAYTELLALKKAAKKSWTALGVNNFEAIQAKFEK